MLRPLVRLVLFLTFLGAPTTASAALAPSEWDSAVMAMTAVDPVIEAPSLDPDAIQVVGGGKPILNASTAFAVSARRDGTAVRGEMTLVVGFGTTYKARVVCVAAFLFPGVGGYAHVVGELTEPASGIHPTLEFFLTDSGLPGGEGDEWHDDISDVPPLDVPCVAAPGVTPIAAGNVVISGPN
jgi:hypothetical protein